MSILFLAILVAIVWYLVLNARFKKSSYHKITGNSLIETYHDVGKLGEYKTYEKLKFFERDDGRFLFNVYIPKENGETTEIDVLLICKKGIFVYESKNYSGWIFGSDKQQYWTQTLPQGRGKSHKERFLNPIIQNKLHIKHLRNLVEENIPIYSIIVFSERCTLKNVSVENADTKVVKRTEVDITTLNLYKSISVELDELQVNTAYEKLYPLSQADNEIKQKHIENILHINKSDCHNNSEEAKCPKCGADLVLRESKRGSNKGDSFYGCSNFPKCRYTKSISEQNSSQPS